MIRLLSAGGLPLSVKTAGWGLRPSTTLIVSFSLDANSLLAQSWTSPMVAVKLAFVELDRLIRAVRQIPPAFAETWPAVLNPPWLPPALVRCS
ncbi:hypothetical protein ACWEQL_32165 [Kitasatospora sp. NPDC004240]